MTNELEDLKECPFCGSTDPEIRYDRLANDLWMCKIACWLDAPAAYIECIGAGDTKEEAYEMAAGFWNRRYKRTCKIERPQGGVIPTCSECGYEETRNLFYCSDGDVKYSKSFCPQCGSEVLGSEAVDDH